MPPLRRFVVTRKEALSILGVRPAALRTMERSAGIPARSNRAGYTGRELRSLLRSLRRIARRAAA